MRLLTIKKALFLLSICLATFSFSQNEPAKINFPIDGLMKVQKNENNEPKRYNYIDFKENTYALKQDEQELFVFEVIAFNNEEYVLKQLSYGNQTGDNNTEQVDIRVKLRELEVGKYEVTFLFPNRTEKIILIKE